MRGLLLNEVSQSVLPVASALQAASIARLDLKARAEALRPDRGAQLHIVLLVDAANLCQSPRCL